MKNLLPLLILAVWLVPGLISGGGVREEQESLDRAQIKALKPLEAVLNRYRSQVPVQIQVEKQVHQALLGRSQTSSGTLTLGEQRLRLEMGAPDQSLLIHDGDYLWMVSTIEGFSGPITQVAKISPRKLGPSATLISAVFERPRLWEEFRLVEQSDLEGGVKSFQLRPKAPMDVSEIQIVIDPKSRLVTQLSYKDDLENETRYNFKRAQFSAKIKEGTFTFVPPEGAEVTEY